MSIDLHCPGCAKLIRAPDTAGGRHGKCPYCGRRVYIPTPESEVEIFDIAEPTEEELRLEEKLRRESASYVAVVSHADGEVAGEAGGDGESVRPPEVPGEVVDLPDLVDAFLCAMRDAKLDAADSAVASLKRAGSRAKDYVEGVMLDEMPPQVEGIPQPVLKGFLKTLLGRL